MWHCRIPASELLGATLYAYRVEGPLEPELGHRFDPQKVVLDPYAPSVFFPPEFSREACAQAGPTDGRAPLGRLPSKGMVALPTIPARASQYSKASVSGRARSAWMVFALISPRSFHAQPTAQ